MRGKGERTEPVARHSSGKDWVQEELALTCPASFPFRAKAGEENSPRDQTMSHRPRSRGCRHTGGGCPGPARGRSAAPGRSRLPGRGEGRRKGSDCTASWPVHTLTPGEERSPPQRAASDRAPGRLRSRPGQARDSGRGGDGRGSGTGRGAAL